MSFKNDVLDLLGYILKEQKATRHAILHQTKLLLENKGKHQDAAVSEQEETRWPVTTGEAIQALRLFCEKTDNDYEKEIMTWAADHLKKEAAPAPKVITWQEAVKALRDICKGQDGCDDCIAREWCDKALPFNMAVITPNYWEVPGDE